MTVSIVQKAAIGNISGASGTLVATFLAPPTPGNEIIAIHSLNINGAVPTWPAGYTELVIVDDSTGLPLDHLSIYDRTRAAVKTIAPGEGSTVTVARAGGDRSTLLIFEVTPGEFTGGRLKFSGATITGVLPNTTTTEPEQLLIGVAAYLNSGFPASPPTGWTVEDNTTFGLAGGNSLLTPAWSRIVAPGAYGGTFTVTLAAADIPVVVFAFEPTPTPPPDPGPVVVIHDPDDVELATLTEAFDVQIRVELNGTGSGSFKINRHSAEATADVLKAGNYVRVSIPQIDPDAIFGFFLEVGDFTLVATDEEGGEDVSFSGRGGLAYWDRAIWINESFLLDWVPAFIRTEHGAPPGDALGAVHYAAGDYRRFTISGTPQEITSRIDFSTGGFSSYYDERRRVLDGSGGSVTLVHLVTGGVSGYWVRPYGSGVQDYPKRSQYVFGASIAMGLISTNQWPGEVLFTMFGEATAADRPIHPIPLMSIDFTDTLDSDGNAWTAVEAVTGISAELGDDFLSTVGKLVNTGFVDVVMGPDLDFHAYNGYGRSLTSDVRFAKAVNIADELVREFSDSPVGTWAEVLGNSEGVIARVELPDAASRTPREISVRGDTDDTEALASLGLGELNARLLHSDAIGFNVATPIIGHEDPDNGLYLPGPPGSAHGDYWVGDLVTLHTGSGEHDFDEAEVRIAAITMHFSDANDLLVTVEVNSGFGGFEANGGSSGSSTSTTGGGTSTLSDLYQLVSERDQPNGYPTLDDDGLISVDELPAFGVTVKDEGSALATLATSFDFVGTGVTASGTGAAKTITIPGGATTAGGLTTRFEPHVDYTGSVVLDGNGDPVMVEVAN